MSEKQDQKKNSSDKKTIFWIVSVLVLFLTIGVICLLFFDSWIIGSRYGKATSKIASDPGRVSAILICDPLYDTGYPLNPGIEKHVDNGETIKNICQTLSELWKTMHYEKKTDSIAGDWDLYVRLTSAEGNLYVYLTNDRIYFTNNGTRYYFKADQEQIKQVNTFLHSFLLAD